MQVAELVVKIGADISDVVKQSESAIGKINQVGQKLKGIGTGLSVGVTAPIVALGTASVLAFDKQAKALAQVEQAVKSTGGTAGFALADLEKQAQALQKTSLFGDEEILQKVTANLLTFTNVGGEAFSRTQQAVVDLSARMGTDLQSATIQLGKALNDPVANLSALSRAGIQFSDDQKDVINAMVEANDLAGAQAIILDELEKQYGGAAEAASRAGLGPFKQLSNTLGDLSEDFGELILKRLTPLIEHVQRAITWFEDLDEGQKDLIVTVGLAAAALGPLAIGLGVVMTAISPISLAIAGVVVAGGLLITHWDEIVAYVNTKWPAVGDTIAVVWDGVVVVFNTAKDQIAAVWDLIRGVWSAGFEFFAAVWDGFSALFSADWASVWDSIKRAFGAIWDGIKAAFEFALESIKNLLPGFVQDFLGFKDDVGGSADALAENITGIGEAGTETAKEVGKAGGISDALGDLTDKADDSAKAAGSVEEKVEDLGKAAGREKEQIRNLSLTLEELGTSAGAAEVAAGRVIGKVEAMGTDSESAKPSVVKLGKAIEGFPDSLPDYQIDELGTEAQNTATRVSVAFAKMKSEVSGPGGLLDAFGDGGLRGVFSKVKDTLLSVATVALPGLGPALKVASGLMKAFGIDANDVISGIGSAVGDLGKAIGGIFGIGSKARDRADEFKKFAEAFQALGIDPSGDLSAQDEAAIRSILTPFRLNGIVDIADLLGSVGLTESDIDLDIGDFLETLLDPANLAVRAPTATGQAAAIFKDIQAGVGAFFDLATQFGVDVNDIFQQVLNALGVTMEDVLALIGQQGSGGAGDVLSGIDPDKGGGIEAVINDFADTGGGPALSGVDGAGGFRGLGRAVQTGGQPATINVLIDGQIVATTVLPHMEREVNLRVQ